MSNLDNEQNPINWLVNQPVHLVEDGGGIYAPEQTLSEMIDTLLASANKDVDEARYVHKRTAMEVVERSLYKTLGISNLEQRVNTAIRELDDFLRMAINGSSPVVASAHTDLLPIGHPLSTNSAEVSTRTRNLEQSKWMSADPRISEEFKPLVASIYLTSPGSVEYNYLVNRLESADSRDVPKDVVVAVTAAINPFAGGNSFLERSARAKLQRRDRLGRFAWMGGGARAFIRDLKGFISSVVGRFVGSDPASDTFDVEFIDDPVLGTGLYRMETKNVAGVKAFIKNLGKKLFPVGRPKSATYANDYAINVGDLQKIDAPYGWSIDKNRDPNAPFSEQFVSNDGYVLRKYDGVDKIPFYSDRTADKNVEVKGLGKDGEIDPNYPVYELFTDRSLAQDRDKWDSDENVFIGYYQSWGDVQASAQRFDKKSYNKIDSKKERKMWGDVPDGDFPSDNFEQVNPSDDKTPFSTYRTKNNAKGEGGYTIRRFQPDKHDAVKADMQKNVSEGADVRGFTSGTSTIDPEEPIFEITRQPAPWENNVQPDVIGYAQDWEDVQSLAEASELSMPRGENPRRPEVKKFKKDTGLDYVDEKDVVLPSDFVEDEKGRLNYTPKDPEAPRARITQDYRGQYVTEIYDNEEDRRNLKPSKTITSNSKQEALKDAAEYLTEENNTKAPSKSQGEKIPQPRKTMPLNTPQAGEELPQATSPVPDVSNIYTNNQGKIVSPEGYTVDGDKLKDKDGKTVAKKLDPSLLQWHVDENGIRIPDDQVTDADRIPERRRVRDIVNHTVVDGNGKIVDFEPEFKEEADPTPRVKPTHVDGFWDANEVSEDEVRKDITDPQEAYEVLFDGGYIEVDQDVAIEAVRIAMEDREFIGQDANAIGRSALAREVSSALAGLPNRQVNRLRRTINPAALNEERAKALRDFVLAKNGEPLTDAEMKFLQRTYRNMGVDLTNMRIKGSSNYLNNNLGAERGKMPQLGTPEDQADFEAMLKRLGIKFESKIMTPDQLTPIQAEMDMGNVGLIMTSWLDPALRKKFGMDDQVLYVTRDGYVIDGHHRWASALLAQMSSGKPIELKTVVVDLDFEDALRIANEYNDHIGVTRQTLGAVSKDAKPTPAREVAGEVGRKARPPKPNVPEATQAPPPLPDENRDLPSAPPVVERKPRLSTPSSVGVEDFGTGRRQNTTRYVQVKKTKVVGDQDYLPGRENAKEYAEWLEDAKQQEVVVQQRITDRMEQKHGKGALKRFVDLSVKVASNVQRRDEIIFTLREWALQKWEQDYDKTKAQVVRSLQRAVVMRIVPIDKNDTEAFDRLVEAEMMRRRNEFLNMGNVTDIIKSDKVANKALYDLWEEGLRLQRQNKENKSELEKLELDFAVFSAEEYRRYAEEQGVEFYDGDGSEIFEIDETLTENRIVYKVVNGEVVAEQVTVEVSQKLSRSAKRKATEAVQKSLQRYPKWQIERLQKLAAQTPSGKIRVQLSNDHDIDPVASPQRGYFDVLRTGANAGDMVLRLSINNHKNRPMVEYEETATHEVGHGIELAIPELRENEWMHVAHQNANLETGELTRGVEILHQPTSPDERPDYGLMDNFRMPYSGRIYDGLNPLSSYEVATTARERMTGMGMHDVLNPRVQQLYELGEITPEQVLFGDGMTAMMLKFDIEGQNVELPLSDKQLGLGRIVQAHNNFSQTTPSVGMSDVTEEVASVNPKSLKSRDVISRLADDGEKVSMPAEGVENGTISYSKGTYVDQDGKTYRLYFREMEFDQDGARVVSGDVDVTDEYDTDLGNITWRTVPRSKTKERDGVDQWDELELPLWYNKSDYDTSKPFSAIGYIEVEPEVQRRGVGTALLEFARRHSGQPLHHSWRLSSRGKPFAEAVKNVKAIEDSDILPDAKTLSDLYNAKTPKSREVAERLSPIGEPEVKEFTSRKLTTDIKGIYTKNIYTKSLHSYTDQDGKKYVIVVNTRKFHSPTSNEKEIGELDAVGGQADVYPEGFDYEADPRESVARVYFREPPRKRNEETGERYWDKTYAAEEAQKDIDESQRFNFISAIETKDGFKHRGLATALLLAARKDSPVPIYHSWDRTPAGRGFSEATQNTGTLVAEDLPEVSPNVDEKSKAEDVKSRITKSPEKPYVSVSEKEIKNDPEAKIRVNTTTVTPYSYKDKEGNVYKLLAVNTESKNKDTGEVITRYGEVLVYPSDFEPNVKTVDSEDAYDRYQGTVGHMYYGEPPVKRRPRGERYWDSGYVAEDIHPDVDESSPFTTIGGIVTYENHERRGLATAMLLIGRETSPVPIYHSYLRTDDGKGFSEAVQNTNATLTEDLPEVSSDTSLLGTSPKSEFVRKTLRDIAPTTVNQINDSFVQAEAKGRYITPDNLKVIFTFTENREKALGEWSVEGEIEAEIDGDYAGYLTWGSVGKVYDTDEYDIDAVNEEVRDEVDPSKPFSNIGYVEVTEELRRQGIATALVEYARMHTIHPLYHSSDLTTQGAKFVPAVQNTLNNLTMAEDLPDPDARPQLFSRRREELPSTSDVEVLTESEISDLVSSSPVTDKTIKHVVGKRGVGSLALFDYKESYIRGFKPPFDADGDVIYQKLYDRAVASGMSPKQADKLANKQTVQIKDIIQRKNDKSLLGYLAKMSSTVPDDASDKVKRERFRWRRSWDFNTKVVKQTLSEALATGKVVEPVNEDKLLRIIEGKESLRGDGFLANDFSVGDRQFSASDEAAPTPIYQVMRTILGVRNKLHDSDAKVVFKPEVRDASSYTVGSPFDEGSIPQPLSNRDEDSMIMAGLMGNLKTPLISIAGKGAPTTEQSEVRVRVGKKVSLDDVESIYVKGKDSVKLFSKLLSKSHPDIEIVDVDEINWNTPMRVIKPTSMAVQNTPSELDTELPEVTNAKGNRVISEKVNKIRENVTLDREFEVTDQLGDSYGNTMEVRRGVGSYLTPRGDIVEFVADLTVKKDANGEPWHQLIQVKAYDENNEFVGTFEASTVLADTTGEGENERKFYPVDAWGKGVDKVAHPEFKDVQESETPLAIIDWISVDENRQREGIGTAMLEFARDNFPTPIYHSSNLSPQGRRYASSVGNTPTMEAELPELTLSPEEAVDLWGDPIVPPREGGYWTEDGDYKYTPRGDKAKEVAKRLVDTKYAKNSAGNEFIEGIYTDKDGNTYDLKLELYTGWGEGSGKAEVFKNGQELGRVTFFEARQIEDGYGERIWDAEELPSWYDPDSYDEYNPFATIGFAGVYLEENRRRGLATAMLEFARRHAHMPIHHSYQLSDDGEAYASKTEKSPSESSDLPDINDKPLPPLVEDEPPLPNATPDAVEKAKIVRERAEEVEPQITSDVMKVASLVGGSLKGLANRIKTTKSLARKIDKDAVDDHNGDRGEAAAEVSDAVRYTMVTSTDNYVTAIKEARSRFEDLGYKITKEKNFWKSDEYKGYTFKLINPDGYAVEFQIHTNESFEIKDDLHPVYEELRVIPKNEQVVKQRQLKSELQRIARQIPVPPDEELFDLGNLVGVPEDKLTKYGREFEETPKPTTPQAPQAPSVSSEELPEVEHPYPLKNDSTAWNMNDTYKPDVTESRGPEAPLIIGGGYFGGNYERRFTGALAYRIWQINNPDATRDDGSEIKFITEDPRYPKFPIEITNEMLVNFGIPDGTKFESLSEQVQNVIKLRALSEMAGARMNYYYGTAMGVPVDVAKVEEYLAAENKAVKEIMREQVLPDGKSVGFVVDDIANQAIKQISMEALDGTISLTMPKNRLRRFMSDGEYKSGHEVPLQEKGATRQEYLGYRDKFELEIMGIPSDAPKPIYAVLNRSKDEQTYGEIQVIFKDSLASRTTVTVGDSLDGRAGGASWLSDWANGDMSVSDFYSSYGRHINTLLNNNNRSSKAIYENIDGSKYPVQTGVSESLFEWEMEEPINSENIVSLYSAKWGEIIGYNGVKDVRTWAESGYLEAQIHGGVKLTDVAKIVVPVGFNMTKAEVQALANLGIEVIKGEPIIGKDK